MTIQAIIMRWFDVTEFLLKKGVSPDVCEDGRKRRFVVHILAAEHQPWLYELAIRMMPDPGMWIHGECRAVNMAQGSCNSLWYALNDAKKKMHDPLQCKHAQGYPFVAEADGNLMPQSCLASHAIVMTRGVAPTTYTGVQAS